MPKQQQEQERSYLITPIGRLSYANIWTPRKKKKETDALVYDAVLIFDQPEGMEESERLKFDALKKAAAKARSDKWPELTSAVQGPFRTTIGYQSKTFWSKPLDGIKNPEYKGNIIISAKSYGRSVEVRRSDNTEMMNKEELYSGCYVRFWVNCFAYENSGSMGVSFSLQGIRKARDGAPLVNRPNAEAAFGSIPVDEPGDYAEGGVSFYGDDDLSDI
jgi:hypothetical protein